MWRASSEKVLQRAIAEARANRRAMDVAETNGPEMESMHREKILQRVASRTTPTSSRRRCCRTANGSGRGSTSFVQAYNTRAVRKQDLPKTWEDLFDPKWKGKLGIEQEDAGLARRHARRDGRGQGTKLFKDIVAKNGMSMRKGHTLLAQLVVSGEIPLALTVYNYKAEQLRGKGAPIDWFAHRHGDRPPERCRCRARGSPSARGGAVLRFRDQRGGPEILAQRDFVPTSRKVDTRSTSSRSVRRSARDARRVRQVGESLPGNLRAGAR